MTARSLPKVASSRWAAALAEGLLLTAGLCAVVIVALVLSRPL